MRLAVVNDMNLAVQVLSGLILEAGHEVAWVARDGQEAVDKALSDRPDLILMDLLMPIKNGVEATREIMRSKPCAILIVTASVSKHSDLVFRALGAGALDAVNTASYGEGTKILGKKIAQIVRLIQYERREPQHETLAPGPCSLIGLGASSGGPAALVQLLSGLPHDLAACVVIVQHIDYSFVRSLCDWLSERTGRTVRPATDGDRPSPGLVLLADTQGHLVFRRERLTYSSEHEELIHKPSIDVFFGSLALVPDRVVACALLTGMGSDGARGLLAVRQAGCHTIAQDKETCTIYGMPKAAQELGAAREILPLKSIAPRLISLVKMDGPACL